MPTTTETWNIPGPSRARFWDDPTSTPSERTGQALQRYFEVVRTKPDRRRKPGGWLVPTPYSLSVIEAVFPSGTFVVQDDWYYDRRETTGILGPELESFYPPGRALPGFKGAHDYGPVGWKNPDSVQLQARAEIQALTKLKDQKVNLAVSAGEARETAEFVGSIAQTLGRAALAVKRGKFKRAARLLKTDVPSTPNKWLAWRYGITPMMLEAKGACEALQSTADDPSGWTQTVKGVIVEPWEYSESGGTSAGSCKRWESGETGAFVRLDMTPDNTFLSTLTSLGLTNPAELVWELLPLSFVADWFVPVGDWLHVLDATAGYVFRSGSCTVRGFGRGVAVHSPGGNGPIRCLSGSAGRSVCKKLTLTRTVYSGFPLPFIPRPRLGLNLARLNDGISLLHQFARR